MEDVIAEYGHNHLGPTYTIKDLWDVRVKASMVPLEEGVLKKWSHGRVVLIGDSVHKVYFQKERERDGRYVARLTSGLTPNRLRSTPVSAATQPTKALPALRMASWTCCGNRHSPHLNS